MADEKPITKQDMLELLKDLPTKKDVEDIVHNKLTEFHTYMTLPALEKLRSDMNTQFDKVGERLNKVDVELVGVKDEIKGLKADLSDTPSREEFEDLKKKVDSYPSIQ